MAIQPRTFWAEAKQLRSCPVPRSYTPSRCPARSYPSGVVPQRCRIVDHVIEHVAAAVPASTILHLRHLHGASLFTKRLIDAGYAMPQCDRLYVQADPELPNQFARLGKSQRRWRRKSYKQTPKKHGGHNVVTGSDGF